MWPTCEVSMCSGLVNMEATIPCLLICHQNLSVNRNFIENYSVVAPVMSECCMSVSIMVSEEGWVIGSIQKDTSCCGGMVFN